MGHRQLPLADKRGRALRSRQAFATDDQQERGPRLLSLGRWLGSGR